MPLPQYTEYRERRTFSSLDGFRCASILPVIWHHSGDGLDWLMASNRGYLGVDMFFVLSGFLIVTLLLRERDTTQTISLPKFYARRAFRIFPIYYAVMLFMVLVLTFVKPDAKMAAPFFSELPYYLTYTANWIKATTFLSVVWSLAAEEQFYFIWPPIEKYFKPFVIPILIVAIAINQLINFQLLNRFIWDMFEVRWIDLPILQATFTPILLGVLLAHILHSQSGFARAWKVLGHKWMPIVFVAAVFLISNRNVWDISGWPRLTIQLSMFLLLGSCVIRDDNILRPVLTLTWVKRIGAISYGMYLFHMFARHGAEFLLVRSPVRFPGDLFILCLLFTYVISDLSFRYYEQPFLRIKKRFETPRQGLGASSG